MVQEYSVIQTAELKVLQSDKVPVEQPVKNEVVVNIIEPTSVIPGNDAHAAILEYMPKGFLKRTKRILGFIEKFPEIISINSDGFLLIKNVLQDGNDISDLIQALLSTLPRKFEPIGIQGFLAAMAEIKLPLSLISNSKYRKIVMNYSKCRNTKSKALSKKQKIKCLRYY